VPRERIDGPAVSVVKQHVGVRSKSRVTS
jgi:hypothetical protein